MRGDPGALYDAHAARMYAYCWSLVGEDAPAAVRDTFVAAVQHPPQGDTVLWLYALARSACLQRGALDQAFGRPPAQPAQPGQPMGRRSMTGDPLLRVAAGLRADHREVLVLAAGEWLDVPDIARVLRIAPDTVRQLLEAAGTRLERGVLDTLMREPGSPYDADIIAAFEKGALPRLLARRAPDRPPPALRAGVLAACEAEAEQPLTTMAASSPLVVIGDAARTGDGRRHAKGLTAVAGVAASVAAAVGLLAAWTSAKTGDDGHGALSPSAGQGSGSTAAGTASTAPARTSSGPAGPVSGAGPASDGPSASTTGPYDPATGGPPPPGGSSPPTSGPTSIPPPGTPSTPVTPPPPKPPAPKPKPSDPKPTKPPTKPPTDPPTQSPEPTDPPTQSPDPSPNPTANPSPGPSDTP